MPARKSARKRHPSVKLPRALCGPQPPPVDQVNPTEAEIRAIQQWWGGRLERHEAQWQLVSAAIAEDARVARAQRLEDLARQAQRQVEDDALRQPPAFGGWMTAAIAAQHLGFSSCVKPADAFRQWAKRAGLVPRGRRGDVPLYATADLDAAVK